MFAMKHPVLHTRDDYSGEKEREYGQGGVGEEITWPESR